MTKREKAERLTCWGWAAHTLGVEAGPDRLLGLVEVTAGIPLANLKPALELAMKSETKGYLPSPGAVIAASKALSEQSSRARPPLPSGPMSDDDRRRWEADNNPEAWDPETWTAFVWRMSNDPAFAARAKRAAADRHAWAEHEVNVQVDRRRTSAGFRIDLRRQLNREAFDHFPRPNPFENGWTMPAYSVDPMAALTGRMTDSPMPRRRQQRLVAEDDPRGDSKGLAAARAAAAARHA